MLNKVLWILLGLSGCSAVALGAYGAHAAGFNDVATGRFETALLYHLVHLAGLLGALLLVSPDSALIARASALLFLAGTVCFSGSLYMSAFSGGETSTQLAPVGGVAFMAGWLALGIAGACKAKTE